MPTSERRAAIEPGADPGRPPKSGTKLFLALIAVLLAGPPLVQVAYDLHAEGSPAILGLFELLPPDRRALRDFEVGMEERSWLAKAARWQWAPRIDAALGRGGRRVVIGRDGWLFYRPAVHFVAGRGFESGGKVAPGGALSPRAVRVRDAVLHLHHQLAERGQHLLFVPMPTKPTLYPEKLSHLASPPRGPADAPNDPQVARLLEALESAGVEVFDPLPVLLAAKEAGIEVFLAADSHLSWRGMQAVVEQVAKEIAARLQPGDAAFEERTRTIAFDGDLYRMLGYPRRLVTGDLRWRPPMRQTVRTVEASRRGDEPIQPRSRVLVLGDSTAMIFSDPGLGTGEKAGFAHRLAKALGRPVDLLAAPAAGTEELDQLLTRQKARLDSAEIVVWLITQRSFRFGRGDWSSIELPR